MYTYHIPSPQAIPRTAPLVGIVSDHIAVAQDGTFWMWQNKEEGGQVWRYMFSCAPDSIKRIKHISRFVKWEQSLDTKPGIR